MMKGFWWRFWLLITLILLTSVTSQIGLLRFLETR